jgi:hypothetical protein
MIRAVLSILLILLLGKPVLAATAQNSLRLMIEADMAGDPTIRVSMAAPHASSAEPKGAFLPQRMGFDLGLSPVEVATSWRMEQVDEPCVHVCQISVLYHVVATSRCEDACDKKALAQDGFGIVKLKCPVDRIVKYDLIKINHDWKIVFFPLPYVGPDAMKNEYSRQLKGLALAPPRDTLIRLREWYGEQLTVLGTLSS